MDEQQWQKKLDLYLLGELSPEAVAEVRAYLRRHGEAAGQVEAVRQIVHELDHVLGEPKASPELADRIIARLGKESVGAPVLRRRPARRTPYRAAAIVAVAAGVVLGLTVWLLQDVGKEPVRRPQVPRRRAEIPEAAPVVRLAAGCRVRPIGPTVYQVIRPRHVRLEQGQLHVEIHRAAADAEPFVVDTPAGQAKAVTTRFLIETRSMEPETNPPTNSKGDPRMTAKFPKARFLTHVFVLAGMVQLLNSGGAVVGSPGELLAAQTDSAPKKHVEDLAGKFGQYYKPVAVDVKPSVPPYPLPIDIRKAANWDKVSEMMKLGPATRKLRQNGFVVVPISTIRGVPRDDIVKPYSTLRRMEIPIFVTTDTLLHLYHVQFDESLKDIEQREFYPDLVALGEMLVGELGEAYTSHRGELIQKQAIGKAWIFAAVGLKCLQPDWTPPTAIAEYVDEVIDKIDKHEGFWPPRDAAYQQWPVFRYSEDFSQYVPRGHYTRSEELKRYFKAMMWFGRMTFLLKGEEPFGPGDQPALVPPEEAQKQTLAAAHLVKLLSTGKLANNRSAREVWQRIYTVTAFYVGLADDLGLPEYEASLRKVVGAAMNLAALSDTEKLRDLRIELAKFGAPAIYGGTGNLITYEGEDPKNLLEALDKTTGFRLMGQRFIPDSYVMGKLVFPTVGAPRDGHKDMFTYVVSDWGPIRGFPRGLDVMAWLGSHRARHWLTELRDDAYGIGKDLNKGRNLRYDLVLDGLKSEFDALSPSDWNRNIYWSWLHTLKALLKEYGQGYPTFMTTTAWQDKSLNTALASWAQLRHDTILYAKQSYTMAGGSAHMPKPVQGYVEPVPEFYARLLATTQMTLAGLKAMDVLQPQAIERLEKLAEIITQLLDISKKELAHQTLTDEQYRFIRHFAKSLERIRVNDPELQKAAQEASQRKDYKRAREIWSELRGDKPMKTTLVADVHTDSNTQQVLEEGTGYIDLMLVCYIQPDGRLVVGAGPVLSYYEFKHPMDDRLTDEKWREMLHRGETPEWPEWTAEYRSE